MFTLGLRSTAYVASGIWSIINNAAQPADKFCKPEYLCLLSNRGYLDAAIRSSWSLPVFGVRVLGVWNGLRKLSLLSGGCCGGNQWVVGWVGGGSIWGQKVSVWIDDY